MAFLQREENQSLSLDNCIFWELERRCKRLLREKIKIVAKIYINKLENKNCYWYRQRGQFCSWWRTCKICWWSWWPYNFTTVSILSDQYVLKWIMNLIEFNISESTTILGAVIDINLNFNSHCAELIPKLHSLSFKLHSLKYTGSKLIDG